jgi:hypothetical protein
MMVLNYGIEKGIYEKRIALKGRLRDKLMQFSM